MARGSAFEVRDHLITARDQDYISTSEHQEVDTLAQRVIQTLNGYIRATQERQGLKEARRL
jgi:four helix bundle protein